MSATTEKEIFKCPAGFGNGNFADPSTCRRFYQVSVGCLFFFSLSLSFYSFMYNENLICLRSALLCSVCASIWWWSTFFQFEMEKKKNIFNPNNKPQNDLFCCFFVVFTFRANYFFGIFFFAALIHCSRSSKTYLLLSLC